MSFVIDHVTHFIKTKDITPGVTYDASTDMVIDVRGMNRKDILIKNAGATGITYTILASLDDVNLHNTPESFPTWDERITQKMTNNIEYDVVHTADTALGATSQVILAFTNLYTFLKIRVKSPGVTTITIKANAATN
jgi:hypothetical protein